MDGIFIIQHIFKSGAIKSTTKKHTSKLWGIILAQIPKNIGKGSFEKEIKKALLSFLDVCGSFVGLNIKFPFALETAKSYEIFSIIIAQTVLSELSYDVSMGSNKDILLIADTTDKETKKILYSWSF